MTAGFGGVAAALSAALGRPAAAAPAEAIGGGSIHAVYRWPTDSGPLLVKLAPAEGAALFAAEAAGLRVLAAANALRVPAVLGQGVTGNRAWLALEWLALQAQTPAAEATLGGGLATLHRVAAARFGFAEDNFIGRTPQPNGWCDDWVEFLVVRRLGFQLALAAGNGHRGRLAERGAALLEAVPGFYAGHRPRPSLLHGDLWHGNCGALADGTPVVFDPAPYFGDREADLAMTRLFGGFGPHFYAAYEASWPLEAGAAVRVGLHNLYHVLNHLNLFGGGYAAQALQLIDRLLADAGR